MPWILYLFQALGSLDLLFKVVVLLRLEFTWGGPMSMVPLGVSRRRHTHSERTSARADLEFSWLARFFVRALVPLSRALVLFSLPLSPQQ